MTTDKEKQIEEMAKILAENCGCCDNCDYCGLWDDGIDCTEYKYADMLYNAGYRKQREGEWEWFEEWSPSTPEHPRECDDCGWRCGKCKVALEDMVGGYWDNAFEKPKLNYCPNCCAKMKGGEGK